MNNLSRKTIWIRENSCKNKLNGEDVGIFLVSDRNREFAFADIVVCISDVIGIAVLQLNFCVALNFINKLNFINFISIKLKVFHCNVPLCFIYIIIKRNNLQVLFFQSGHNVYS